MVLCSPLVEPSQTVEPALGVQIISFIVIYIYFLCGRNSHRPHPHLLPVRESIPTEVSVFFSMQISICRGLRGKSISVMGILFKVFLLIYTQENYGEFSKFLNIEAFGIADSK